MTHTKERWFHQGAHSLPADSEESLVTIRVETSSDPPFTQEDALAAATWVTFPNTSSAVTV